MNDEGIGIAGWLLADLVLVLAIVFLAFTPAALSGDAESASIAEATPVAAPLILDIGCVEGEQTGRSIPVRCEPDLAGGAVDSYKWEADGGWARSVSGADYFAASFADAGAVRLTVTNEGGEHTTAFFVRPSPTPRATTTGTPMPAPTLTPARAATPTPTEAPDCSEVRTDFRFAQIVVMDAALDTVEWEDIAQGRVRENLIKSEEDDPAGGIDDGEWLVTGGETFLRRKHGEGFRIALVETFSHAPGDSQAASGDPHIRLSGQVNDVFVEGLNRLGIDIFVDQEAARENWFADYRDRSALRSGEVRINLYFVKPFDNEDCQ